MAENRIHMKEVEYCLYCKKHIGKGHDPAVCSDPFCLFWVRYEMEFTSWAKNELKKSHQSEG